MAYGTLQGLRDTLQEFQKYVDTSVIPESQFERYLEKASRYIDARLSGVPGVSLPLAAPPEVIHDIAVELAVCYTLRFLAVEKDPNASDYVNLFCDDPKKALDELIAKNSELFGTGASTSPLMLSNTVGKKRVFTAKVDDDDADDTGTMEDW